MRHAWLLTMALLAGCGTTTPMTDYVRTAIGDGTAMAATGDTIAYCRGFGMSDRERGIRAGCDTVYDIMSITKQFTAAAVLKLETQGKLRTTDRITRFLDHVPADKAAITLDQLLTHTSGLPETVGDDYEPVTRDAMVARVLAARRGPRAFHYSNAGYSLLAAIVEKASGMGYERYLATNLFTPAGMTRTGYVLPRWDPRDVAVEYDAAGRAQGRPYDHPWASDGPYWNLRGNGGLLSTARDLFRWHRALAGTAVLTESAKRELFRPRVPTQDGESYAYGWDVKDGFAWHDGGNGWSLALLGRWARDGTVVFWVSNHASTALEDSALDLTRGMADRVRTMGEQ